MDSNNESYHSKSEFYFLYKDFRHFRPFHNNPIEKYNMLFVDLGRSALGKTVPDVSSMTRGCRPWQQITYIYDWQHLKGKLYSAIGNLTPNKLNQPEVRSCLTGFIKFYSPVSWLCHRYIRSHFNQLFLPIQELIFWQLRHRSNINSNHLKVLLESHLTLCHSTVHHCSHLKSASEKIHKTTFTQLNANNSYSYIPRISLIKTSIVIGWFLVMCPWLNSDVSWQWCHCAVVARMLNTTARDQCTTKLKMVWSSAHAHISLIDDFEWRSCAVFVCLFLLYDC